MTAKFTPDYRGIGVMLASGWMQAEMLRRAAKMKEYAERIAPRDVRDKDGEYYRDFFHISSGVQHHKTNRAYGELSNDHPAAMSIEFGTGEPKGSRTPAHHTLRRALDAAKE